MATLADPVECAYCQQDVARISDVPAPNDNASWNRVARDHAPSCEWVTSRAHTYPTLCAVCSAGGIITSVQDPGDAPRDDEGRPMCASCAEQV